jgi:hypothetical protein
MEEENLELKEWIDKYGTVTSYSFMIYGPMSIRDNAIINKGLTLTLVSKGFGDIRYIQLTEEMNPKRAELFGTYRGWNIQWVFPGNVDADFIEDIISEGLEFLRLKYEYIGKIGGNGNAS